MQIVVYGLVLSVLVLVVSERRYFREQKRQNQKYPFYQLRDAIVFRIATSESEEQCDRVYAAVNSSIEHLDAFNLTFFANAASSVFEYVLEQAYQNTSQTNEEMLDELIKRDLDPFAKEYLKLITKTARDNSLLLRLAMTRVGFQIFFTTNAVRSLIRFLARHPELLRNHRDDFRVFRDYSYLGQIAARV